MALKLRDPNSLTYPAQEMGWAGENVESQKVGKAGVKKKRRPANLCIECPVCGGPAPDHLHFGGQSCYSCRAFFRRTSPRPISSFRCRSGLNNCVINSGSKSCIPCRLTKCLKTGMDPALVRGKKNKEDSDSDEPRNLYEDEYITESLPPLTPIGQTKQGSSEGSQESVLKFRAEVLKYQGMCLQYQASLLEKQAKTMSLKQENYDYPSVDGSKYDYHMVPREDSPLYRQPNNHKDLGMVDRMNNMASSHSDYETNYRAQEPMYSKGYGQDLYCQEARYTDTISNQSKCHGSMYSHNNKQMSTTFEEREGSPVRKIDDFYSSAYSYRQDDYSDKERFSSHLPYPMCSSVEEDRLSPGPMDLSMRKNSQSPRHTQAENMPRIFFRMEQSRV